MRGIAKEHWMELCDEAANEQDPAKFQKLIDDIAKLLAEKKKRVENETQQITAVESGGMENARMSYPLGVCSACGAFVFGSSQIGMECGNRFDGNRCNGIYEPGFCFDFKDCPACNATGKQEEQRCSQCNGKRWFAIRHRLGR